MQAPPGIAASASLQNFTIKPGQTQDITVTAQWNGAPINAWTFGALLLTDGTRTLRLPISIKPGFTTVPGVISVAASTAGARSRSRSRRASPPTSAASGGA